tara:strand:+ start:277 stop:516 length:240 start_codon:yes stop_codon:yes gene_type:complete
MYVIYNPLDKGKAVSSQKYYEQLEGFTIKKYLGEDAEGFPEFILTKPRYEDVKITVSSDPEAKHGGYLFIINVGDKKGE